MCYEILWTVGDDIIIGYDDGRLGVLEENGVWPSAHTPSDHLHVHQVVIDRHDPGLRYEAPTGRMAIMVRGVGPVQFKRQTAGRYHVWCQFDPDRMTWYIVDNIAPNRS